MERLHVRMLADSLATTPVKLGSDPVLSKFTQFIAKREENMLQLLIGSTELLSKETIKAVTLLGFQVVTYDEVANHG